MGSTFPTPHFSYEEICVMNRWIMLWVNGLIGGEKKIIYIYIEDDCVNDIIRMRGLNTQHVSSGN